MIFKYIQKFSYNSESLTLYCYWIYTENFCSDIFISDQKSLCVRAILFQAELNAYIKFIYAQIRTRQIMIQIRLMSIIKMARVPFKKTNASLRILDETIVEYYRDYGFRLFFRPSFIWKHDWIFCSSFTFVINLQI